MPPPAADPLHIEAAGGGQGVAVSEASRRLAKAAGLSEKAFEDSAKRFKPNAYNSLED